LIAAWAPGGRFGRYLRTVAETAGRLQQQFVASLFAQIGFSVAMRRTAGEAQRNRRRPVRLMRQNSASQLGASGSALGPNDHQASRQSKAESNASDLASCVNAPRLTPRSRYSAVACGEEVSPPSTDRRVLATAQRGRQVGKEPQDDRTSRSRHDHATARRRSRNGVILADQHLRSKQLVAATVRSAP